MKQPLTENQKLLLAIRYYLPRELQEVIHKQIISIKMSDFLLSYSDFAWKVDDLLQADLIARIYTGKAVLYPMPCCEDTKTFSTLNKNIQKYLIDNPKVHYDECVIQ